jgi:hypothetical protein
MLSRGGWRKHLWERQEIGTIIWFRGVYGVQGHCKILVHTRVDQKGVQAVLEAFVD